VGITLAGVERVEEALPWLRRAQVQDARWAEVVRRLPVAGLLPDDPALVARLIAEMQRP
jgi:hypothetical protein